MANIFALGQCKGENPAEVRAFTVPIFVLLKYVTVNAVSVKRLYCRYPVPRTRS